MKHTIVIFSLFFSSLALPQQDNTVIKIPVLFHVVYNNEKENIPSPLIAAELNNLINDFLSANTDQSNIIPLYKGLVGNPAIQFYLADTVMTEKGIVRIKKTKWGKLYKSSPVIHPDRYLNVYIGNIYNIFTKTTGVVYDDHAWASKIYDGVFLHYDRVGKQKRMLTHETGHWLGLHHIFRSSRNCNPLNDDGIADTPSQKYASGDTHKSRDYNLDPVANACNPDLPAMYNNFMDYSKRRVMFTIGQAAAMRNIMMAYRRKMYLNGLK